jgi:hypothetical protein
MRVWRIATDTPDFVADDLTGTGARLTGGRWNRPGQPVFILINPQHPDAVALTAAKLRKWLYDPRLF